jgi:hypothetical protein
VGIGEGFGVDLRDGGNAGAGVGCVGGMWSGGDSGLGGCVLGAGGEARGFDFFWIGVFFLCSSNGPALSVEHGDFLAKVGLFSVRERAGIKGVGTVSYCCSREIMKSKIFFTRAFLFEELPAQRWKRMVHARSKWTCLANNINSCFRGVLKNFFVVSQVSIKAVAL